MANLFLKGQLTDISSVTRRDLARSVPGMAHLLYRANRRHLRPVRVLATSGTEPERDVPKVRRADAEGADKTGARLNTCLPVL